MARDRILSRRAKFVAAAIATMAASTRRSSAEVGIPESDTTVDAPVDSGVDAPAKDTGTPEPCLSIAKPDDDPAGCTCSTPR
jgi:hypothetical protein